MLVGAHTHTHSGLMSVWRTFHVILVLGGGLVGLKYI